jgi:hypothetical protein
MGYKPPAYAVLLCYEALATAAVLRLGIKDTPCVCNRLLLINKKEKKNNSTS